MTKDQALGSGQPTQSGDTQGLSDVSVADFESVKGLVEEGQYLEAAAVDGSRTRLTADAGPIKTRGVPEDDVPDEYRPPGSRTRKLIVTFRTFREGQTAARCPGRLATLLGGSRAKKRPKVRFIFVSGTIGEDVAVEAMRGGSPD
jgi:hypothetical protein